MWPPKPALLVLLPDVEIFHKAVDWAARDGEFYRSNEVDVARGLLSQGMERAARLRAGDAPWAASGKTPHSTNNMAASSALMNPP